MTRSSTFPKLTATILCFVLFLPVWLELTHHHEEFLCTAKNEKHLHHGHEKCYVCEAVHSPVWFESATLTTQILTDFIVRNTYWTSLHYQVRLLYSFQLRAPPAYSFLKE